MLPSVNVFQAYQKNKYETASPHRLIIMLYDGAIRFANQAIQCIQQRDIEGKSKYIQKFQDIIYELISSLNFKEGKDIAESLATLYTYLLELSTRSNIDMTIEPLQESIGIVSEIKDSWEQIGREVQING